MSLKVFPNVLVRDHEHKKVLLCMKKRGFGADKWSFCGLHPVGENEGLAESAIRQTKEETGLTVTDLKHVGYIETQVGHDVLAGNLYLANKFKGQIEENDDLRPEWFDENQLPTTHRWLDDKFWLDQVLQNKFIKARFVYTENLETLINHQVQVFDTQRELDDSLRNVKHIQEWITKAHHKPRG